MPERKIPAGSGETVQQPTKPRLGSAFGHAEPTQPRHFHSERIQLLIFSAQRRCERGSFVERLALFRLRIGLKGDATTNMEADLAAHGPRLVRIL